MNYQFRPAVREDSIPLIGLYAPSGHGKTFSALLLARGFVGPEGKIAMVDTESGRGSLYSDQIPGGYDTACLNEPFGPANYIEAIQAAEAAGYDIIVIDSASHEWEGIGGVLDMAGEIEERTKKKGLHCWNQPKREHGKFVNKLLGSKIPVIVCIRAKHKSRQVRVNGKAEIIKDDFTSPIQAEDFIFEMTVHAEVMSNHGLRITKCSHPDLATCFEDGQPITIQTGERVAQWAKGETKQRRAIEVHKEAREAASKGKASLEAWWEQASKEDRVKAKSIASDLEQLCKKHDEPNGDTFPGDQPPGSQT